MSASHGDRVMYPRIALNIVESSGMMGHLKLITEKVPINSSSVRRLIYVAIHEELRLEKKIEVREFLCVCEQAGVTRCNFLTRKLCSKVREAKDQKEGGPTSSWI